MGKNTSSIRGAAMAHRADNRPTRLVRASVVDIRTAIGPSGIPRMQADCIGMTTREVINGAVVLGWSGMLWQQSRPVLTPTTRNIITGTKYSDNAIDRMAEMAYDMISAGWDGDEVCIAFYGRTAVVMGTFQHELAWVDLEPNKINKELEPGRRLQDDPNWDVTNIDGARDILYPAQNDSHPDALPFRWGRVLATTWETRGFVAEIRRPNNEDGKEGTYYDSYSAVVEFSFEWFRVESRNIRFAALNKDDPNKSTTPTDRHILAIGDGSESSFSFPVKDWLTDGFLGIVTEGSDYVRAFSATTEDGGVSTKDELAGATRYPELRNVLDAMQEQIKELQSIAKLTRDYLDKLIAAVFGITFPSPAIPSGIDGKTAIENAGLPGTIDNDLTPVNPDPDAEDLATARSSIFRVGR